MRSLDRQNNSFSKAVESSGSFEFKPRLKFHGVSENEKSLIFSRYAL